MKLTKSKLQQIIKEELDDVLSDGLNYPKPSWAAPSGPVGPIGGLPKPPEVQPPTLNQLERAGDAERFVGHLQRFIEEKEALAKLTQFNLKRIIYLAKEVIRTGPTKNTNSKLIGNTLQDFANGANKNAVHMSGLNDFALKLSGGN